MDALTLDDKLKFFSDNVYEKLKLQKDAEIDKYKSEINKAIEVEQKKLELCYEAAVEKIDRKNSKIAAEIVAKEKSKRQQEILNLKKEILKDLTFSVEIELIAFVNSSKYKNYLLKSIKEGIAQIEEDNYKVYFTKKDIDRYSQDIKAVFNMKKVQIKAIDSKIIGGYILEDYKGKIRRDNTIKTKLSDLQEYLGLRLTELIC